ncbi:MAG: lasso peptide biosynthesis protein [Thermoleophilia bacterium]
MKLLRTLNRLKDPRDLWLFLLILTTLVILPRRIRRLSLPDLLKQIDPGVAPIPRSKSKLAKTSGFVDSLLKYRIFQRYGKCLLRSLVLFHFLRRQGWAVEIHFGVRRTGEAETAAGSYAAGMPQKSPGSSLPVFPSLPAHAGGPLDITGHSWLILDGKPFLEAEHQQGIFATTFVYPPQ